MSLMAQVWLHADWVKCLHPGWDLLVGWDEVQGSWEEIFRSTEQMMVSISRPLVHVAGDVAWISCLENVTTAYQNDISSALVEATNIFLRRQGRWLLVHHHTTPLAAAPAGCVRARTVSGRFTPPNDRSGRLYPAAGRRNDAPLRPPGQKGSLPACYAAFTMWCGSMTNFLAAP